VSDPQIDVEVFTGIDQISVDMSDPVTQIELSDISTNIQVVEISTSFSAVESVNQLSGDITLTYVEVLTYVSPSGGIYTYTINHNLNYETPIVMVYNTDNESVIVDHDVIDTNTIEVRSLSNMNNFRVVVQR